MENATIGLTVKTIEAKWWEHVSDARRNTKRKFFAAINKYSKENKKWDDKGKRGWKMENGICVWFVKQEAAA